MPKRKMCFLVLFFFVIVTNAWDSCIGASEINLFVGESRILQAKLASRVAISSPDLAEVTVVTPNEVLINGKKAGSTTLYVWDNTGRDTYYVNISQDTESMVKAITKAIDRPEIRVKVIKNSIVLEGTVDSVEKQTACEKIARAFGLEVINLITIKPNMVEAVSENENRIPEIAKKDLLNNTLRLPGLSIVEVGNGIVLQGWVDNQYEQQKAEKTAALIFDKVVSFIEVKNPTQIEVEVKVVEIGKTIGSKGGVEWGGFAGGLFEPGVFSIRDYSKDGIIIGVATPGFGVKIETLGKNGNLKTLANPKITTLAGQKANVLVGGEFPVGLLQADGKIAIEWKSFGVKLDIEPAVNVLGNISLKVQPEVSTLDWTNAVTYGNMVLPLIKVRRISTDVSIDDGGTLVLGGLIQNEESKTVNKIPLLGDIPILGNLFRSTEFQNGETELVIFITPRILKRPSEQSSVSLISNVSADSDASDDAN